MAKQTFTTGQVLTSAEMTALQLNDYNQTVSAKVASYTLVATDAGTRITMSNAGATTITVNTSLFTAGDTLFITNIGAGACTITAGTATVSTASSLVLAQYDSGRLYFTSTGVAIWEKYQGASSSTPAFSVVKARTNFSGVADTGTTFDNVFTSSYRNYFIVFDNISATTGTDDFLFQLRYAGPTTQATGYYAVNIQATTGSTTVTNTAGSTGPTIQLSDNIGTSVNPGYGFAYVIDAGNSSAKSTILGQYHEMVTSGGGSFSGGNENSRIYTGFILKSSSSNISGNVTVYGMVTA